MQDTEKTALEYFSDRIRKAVLGAVQSSGILSCLSLIHISEPTRR